MPGIFVDRCLGRDGADEVGRESESSLRGVVLRSSVCLCLDRLGWTVCLSKDFCLCLDRLVWTVCLSEGSLFLG